jgi:hypothetical protein
MPNANTPKLTDTQLIILSAAVQRDDGVAVLPDRLKGGAAKAVLGKLLALGFLKEVRVRRDEPAWREDEEEKPIGLKITNAGSAAVGVADQGDAEPESVAPAQRPRNAAAIEKLTREPRAGSKQAQIIALLRRKTGATLNDLIAATGWLPHTTRAALTGLRKKGYAVEKAKRATGATAYHVTGEPTGAASERAR